MIDWAAMVPAMPDDANDPIERRRAQYRASKRRTRARPDVKWFDWHTDIDTAAALKVIMEAKGMTAQEAVEKAVRQFINRHSRLLPPELWEKISKLEG